MIVTHDKYLDKEGLSLYLIENKNEIIKNIKLIDSYLKKGSQQEKEFALALIKKGICFVVIKGGNTYKFYPSRFLGYVDNNMDAHVNNDNKDGRKTNPKISVILGTKPVFNLELEEEYVRYCEQLGFKANKKGSFGVERKYWLLD